MSRVHWLAVPVIAAFVLCAPAGAQELWEAPASESGSALASDPGAGARLAPSQSDPDFFFGRPVFTLTLRMGAFAPRAGSEFHEFAFERFTMSRGDLTAFTGGVEGAIWLGNHAEINLALDGAGVTRETEYREFVEELGGGAVAPIRQNTRFSQGPALTLGFRFFPLERGEELSQHVWVPRTVAPFTSIGIGLTGYAVEQWGDFVDEGDNSIFTEEFSADGASWVLYLGGGLDITLRPQVALVLDGRYSWGRDRMTGDFFRFEPIDLAGLRLTAGLSYRF